MAGIYLHVPFCKSKCNYCDFYSVIDLKSLDRLVDSEILELNNRKQYIENEVITSIYFGGGTPSLLSISHIDKLLGFIRNNFLWNENCEITLEANPEDLNLEYLTNLFKIGINRLSIGIQSFNNDELKFLGRRHDNKKLENIILLARNSGFSNISIDLIFGIANSTKENYFYTLENVVKLGVQHISAYSLTIEKGTYFYKAKRKNIFNEISEENLVIQFNTTIDFLEENSFLQYEISNFALNGYKSHHNSCYWNNSLYLGIGPSAHSYNGFSRQWNYKSISKYCLNVKNDNKYFEIEILNDNDKFNEYILTGFRTSIGISLNYLHTKFHEKYCVHLNTYINKFVIDKLMIVEGDRVILTRKGILMSDFVIRSCFYL